MQTRFEPLKYAKYHFRSLAEFGEYISRAPRKWKATSSISDGKDIKWDLGLGYDGAVKLAREGWLEGAERVQDALKVFPASTPAPTLRTDFYGHMPHVARFCAGAPDSMIRHAKDADSGSRPVLTLLVPIATMWWTNAKCMANFGVAVAQYVNQMEMNGTRVEVIAGMTSTYTDRTRQSHAWVVKYADQPLDLAVLSFAIGHPAAARRLGFAAIERGEAREDANYGVPTNMKVSDLINPAPGTIILNGMVDCDKHAQTQEKALEYITKQIDAAIAAQELEQ